MNARNFGFSVNGVNDKDTIENIEELNQLLNSLGISFDLTPYEKTANNEYSNTGYLGIRIDTDTLFKMQTRNAGRKTNYNKGKNYKIRPFIHEVFEWRKTMTHQQIIDKIGCPRATYYRRMKELSEVYGITDCDNMDDMTKRMYFL